VAVLQIARNGPVSTWFADSEAGFRRIKGALSPSGTLVHANALGCVAAVATMLLVAFLACPWLEQVDRRLATVGVLIGSSLTVLTLTRSAVISLVLLSLVGVLSRSRRFVIGPLLGGVALGTCSALFRIGAWVERGQASVGGVETAGSGRVALARQAIEMFKREPVFGVGPGGYFTTIFRNPSIARLSTETVQVHNIWLYVLATTGVVGVCALTGLAIEIVAKAWRGGVLTVGLVAVLAPMVLLDAALFVGVGPAWTAAAIGAILGISTLDRGSLGDRFHGFAVVRRSAVRAR
jgi:O-antigen ligase